MAQRVGFGPFSIDVPERWTLTSVILSGPVEEAPAGRGMLTTKAVPPFQRNLITTMEVVGPNETVDSFVKRTIEAMSAYNVRQELASPEAVALGDGSQGLLTEQVTTGDNGQKVRQMVLSFIKDGVAITAIASHLDGPDFEKHRQEFRTMLLSYR